MISKKCFIKASLSNAYNSVINILFSGINCSKEIKIALTQILPDDVDNSMTIFFECHDIRCQHSSGKKHLTRVHIKHLVFTQQSHQKLQLNQQNPPSLQGIHNIIKCKRSMTIIMSLSHQLFCIQSNKFITIVNYTMHIDVILVRCHKRFILSLISSLP